MQSLIVIPTFNRAHQVGRAIAAALDQSQDDVMVAVIDDGSSDATQSACEAWFAHPRFIYIGLQRNIGTAGAKNVALALLEFDAVTFHDSDDIPHRDKILRQQRILERQDLIADQCLPWSLTGGAQQPGSTAMIDLVVTAHQFLSAGGGSARIARTLSLVDDFFPNLQFGAGPLGDWVLINSGLFRRTLLARTGGYTDSVEEDRDLRNRALMHGANIWFIDDVLLTKYEQSDSLTAQANTGYVSVQRRDDRARVWRTIEEWKTGKQPDIVEIDLKDVGLSFVSAPDRLKLATDIAISASTRSWLARDCARLS
jgi:glycosyltransferase involved in cell wall biosynthesis